MYNYVIKSPGRYIQEVGIIDKVGEVTKHLGIFPLILITKSNYDRIGDRLLKSFHLPPDIVYVDNDTTIQTIAVNRSMSLFKNDVVIGIGGGSVIDLAKHYANESRLNCVIIPTVCSSDAACTSMIVPKSYDDRDTMMIRASKNPDMVLVDPKVVVTAPIKYMLAGIGDAIATYYEAVACNRVNGITMSHGDTPVGFINQARFLKSRLFSVAREAIGDIAAGKVTDCVEHLVACCIYHSGLLSENCGLSIAHAFSLACDEVFKENEILHGYKVAYGLLVQLTVEYRLGLRDFKDFFNVKCFYESIGLPTTIDNMGIVEYSRDDLRAIAKSICQNKLSKNITGDPLDEELIYRAIRCE